MLVCTTFAHVIMVFLIILLADFRAGALRIGHTPLDVWAVIIIRWTDLARALVKRV